MAAERRRVTHTNRHHQGDESEGVVAGIMTQNLGRASSEWFLAQMRHALQLDRVEGARVEQSDECVLAPIRRGGVKREELQTMTLGRP